MAKILLDYVFPISVITPTPAASTAFLKQVCLIAKPKAGQEGNVGQFFECTNNAAVAARTDNLNAVQLFAAGMSKVIILLADDLDVGAFLDENPGEFYTLLVSDDFDDADLGEVVSIAGVKASLKIEDILYTAKNEGVAGNAITITYVDDGTAGSETVGVVGTAITVHMDAGASTATQISTAVGLSAPAMALIDKVVDAGDGGDVQAAHTVQNLAGGVDEETEEGSGLTLGGFKGVVGVQSQDADFAAEQAAIENRCAFFSSVTHKAKNLCYAFGKLLSNPVTWNNQQYVTMPVNDGVDELGEANSLFDDKVSFVIADSEFGTRLGLFAAGGKAIVAPYIVKNICIDLQSKALQWISGNQPAYTLTNATLLENRLQEDVINSYISRALITAGIVEISLVEDNFRAAGAINIAEPKALWRVASELRQTL